MIELCVDFNECTSLESPYNLCMFVNRPRLESTVGDVSSGLSPFCIGPDDAESSRFFAVELPMQWRRFPQDLTLVRGIQETRICPGSLTALEFRLSRDLDLSISSPASLPLTVWSRTSPLTLPSLTPDKVTQLDVESWVVTLRDKSGTFISSP